MKLIKFLDAIEKAKLSLQKQCSQNGYDATESITEADILLLDKNYFQITLTTDDFQTYIIAEIDNDKLTFIEIEFIEY